MVTINNHTLQQSVDGIYALALLSVPYAKTLPTGDTPFDIFYYLKGVTKYHLDAPGIEQIQKLETLLGPNNIHGKPGAGDCDCFTTAILACLFAQGYKKAYIVLVGNTTKEPTHVYAAVDYWGKKLVLDLTTSEPGKERTRNSKGPYKGKQVITCYY